jgi:hypothetical protein
VTRRAVVVVAIVALIALGIGAAVWATSGPDCERTTLSVSDPGSPKTMKVHRKQC